jgi:hypothetical protein
MTTHRLVLMIAVAGAIAAGSRALADERLAQTKGSPPETKTGDPRDQAFGNKDLQEQEKRARERFLAQCQEDERLNKEKVRANPRDARAWMLLGFNAASRLSGTTEDVNGRYALVKRGIEYLLEGVKHNPTDAELYYSVGFHLHHSVDCGFSARRSNPGRALFRKDKELHKLLAGPVEWRDVTGPDGLPDNLLAARRWYEKAVALIDKHSPPAEAPGIISPLLLHSCPAISQGAYARALEEEGDFGERAVDAWEQALKLWEALGEREFAAEPGTKFRLKDNETARAVVNYDYWRRRCEAETTEPVLAARRAVYRAEQYLAKHRREGFTAETRREAKALFDEAFRAWAEIHKKLPLLLEDGELEGVVYQYRYSVLKGPVPDDSPLRQIPSLWPPKR